MKLIELNDLSEAYTSSGSKEKKDNTFKTTMKKLHNGSTKVIFSPMDESADQGLAEGDVVQFPQKHPWYAAKTCPECEGSLVGGKTSDGRVKYCMGCGAVYPEPNTDTNKVARSRAVKKESEELGEGFFSKKTSGKKQPENFTAFYSADDKMEAGEAKKNFYKELKIRFPKAEKSPGGTDSISWMENGKKVYGNDTSWIYKGKTVAGSHIDEDGDRNWFIYF